MMNWLIGGRTPSRSSAVFIDSGMTAAELDVEKASSITSRAEDRNFNGFIPPPMAAMARNMTSSSNSPSRTVPT